MNKLLIIIPVYNEERILEDSVSKIKTYFDEKFAHDGSNIQYDIAIAGRSSTDRTNEIAQRLEEKYKNVFHSKIDHPDKGGRIHKISMNSDYDFYAFIDCDLPISMDEFYTIIYEVLYNGSDMAIASKYIPGAGQKRLFRRILMSRVYNLLIRLLLPQIKTHDALCGAKAWNKKVATTVFPLAMNTHYFFDTEILYYCFKKGYRVTEVPIFYNDIRADSTIKIFSDSWNVGISLLKFFIQKQILHK